MQSQSILFVFLLVLNVHSAVNKASSEDVFKECLVTNPSGTIGYCMGYGVLSKLQNLDSSPEFDLVDGLKFTRDEKMYREGYSSLETSDPNDYRAIIDSFGNVFAKRSMQWDMGFLYPGLTLRVSPSSVGGGILEFAMDPLKEASFSQHSLKEASTGRILARQFLVPLLLGFKFNLATLIPVIFGLIALLAKKALLLGKVALVISSAFSIGSLLFSHNGNFDGYGYQQHPHYPGFVGPHHYRYQEEEYSDGSSYRGNNAYSQDQLRLYDGELQQVFSREEKKQGRNFAWNENEKKAKS